MYKRITLPYKLNDLSSVFSEEQLDLHYNKHHKGYETKLNNAFQEAGIECDKPLEYLVQKYFKFKAPLATKIRMFGGGLINHNYFFTQFLENKTPTRWKIKSCHWT